MSKNSFWQKPDFVKINEFSLLKLKKCKNRKIDTFTFLAISLAIFELQRHTIPHFNPLNNSFWPYGETFFCRVNSFWAILLNVSTIFFGTHFSTKTDVFFRLFKFGTFSLILLIKVWLKKNRTVVWPYSSKTMNARAKLLMVRSKWIVERIEMRYCTSL